MAHGSPFSSQEWDILLQYMRKSTWNLRLGNDVGIDNDEWIDMKNDKELRSLKALSDETRVRLVLLLEDEEACVCELMDVFNMTQPRISHHLIMLKDAGFLQNERRGRWNYYSLAKNTSNPINSRLVEVIQASFGDNPVAKKDRTLFHAARKRIRKSC